MKAICNFFHAVFPRPKHFAPLFQFCTNATECHQCGNIMAFWFLLFLAIYTKINFYFALRHRNGMGKEFARDETKNKQLVKKAKKTKPKGRAMV